ncbi:MAG: ROK family protein, partial [Spirochaetaceae bacterium]
MVANEELTRNELAHRCGISLGTVATILEELGHLGVVVETKDSRASVGRKPNIVRVVRNAKKILALDLASRNFAYEFLGVDLREEGHGTHRFEPTRSFEENLRAMLREIRDYLERIGLRDEAIIGVGVSVPGSYRYGIDRIDNSPFPELHSISLKTLIQEYFSQPILIDHDVFLAARAEIQHYPEYEKRNVFYVFLGEGVGGALV